MKNRILFAFLLFLMLIFNTTNNHAENVDINDFEIVHVLEVYTEFQKIKDISWSPDGLKIAASYSQDSMIIIWDIENEIPIKTIENISAETILWSPDGQKIASADGENITIWEVENNYEKWKILTGNVTHISSLSWSKNGNLLAAGSFCGLIEIWEIKSGTRIQTLGGEREVFHTIQFSPDNKMLASGSNEGLVKIWNVITSNCEKTLEGHDGWIKSVSWSPDGDFLVSGSGNNAGGFSGEIKIWVINTYNCIRTINDHTHHVSSIAWHPDGLKFASGSQDRFIKIWERNTWKNIKTLNCERGVESIDWDNDGHRIAAAVSFSKLKIYGHTPDLVIGQEDVKISPDKIIYGDNLTVNISIKNNGNVDSSNITVYFYVEGSRYFDKQVIGIDTISLLKGKERKDISITWQTPGLEEIESKYKDDIIINVKIDPFDNISEYNETNNDLEINNIYLYPKDEGKTDENDEQNNPNFIPSFELFLILIVFTLFLVYKRWPLNYNKKYNDR